jgi:hypothetical protein
MPIYSDPRKKLVNSGWRHALALARIRFGGIRGAGCQHRHCDVARVGHLIKHAGSISLWIFRPWRRMDRKRV